MDAVHVGQLRRRHQVGLLEAKGFLPVVVVEEGVGGLIFDRVMEVSGSIVERDSLGGEFKHCPLYLFFLVSLFVENHANK